MRVIAVRVIAARVIAALVIAKWQHGKPGGYRANGVHVSHNSSRLQRLAKSAGY